MLADTEVLGSILREGFFFHDRKYMFWEIIYVGFFTYLNENKFLESLCKEYAAKVPKSPFLWTFLLKVRDIQIQLNARALWQPFTMLYYFASIFLASSMALFSNGFDCRTTIYRCHFENVFRRASTCSAITGKKIFCFYLEVFVSTGYRKRLKKKQIRFPFPK